MGLETSHNNRNEPTAVPDFSNDKTRSRAARAAVSVIPIRHIRVEMINDSESFRTATAA